MLAAQGRRSSIDFLEGAHQPVGVVNSDTILPHRALDMEKGMRGSRLSESKKGKNGIALFHTPLGINIINLIKEHY